MPLSLGFLTRVCEVQCASMVTPEWLSSLKELFLVASSGISRCCLLSNG